MIFVLFFKSFFFVLEEKTHFLKTRRHFGFLKVSQQKKGMTLDFVLDMLTEECEDVDEDGCRASYLRPFKKAKLLFLMFGPVKILNWEDPGASGGDHGDGGDEADENIVSWIMWDEMSHPMVELRDLERTRQHFGPLGEALSVLFEHWRKSRSVNEAEPGEESFSFATEEDAEVLDFLFGLDSGAFSDRECWNDRNIAATLLMTKNPDLQAWYLLHIMFDNEGLAEADMSGILFQMLILAAHFGFDLDPHFNLLTEMIGRFGCSRSQRICGECSKHVAREDLTDEEVEANALLIDSFWIEATQYLQNASRADLQSGEISRVPVLSLIMRLGKYLMGRAYPPHRRRQREE